MEDGIFCQEHEDFIKYATVYSQCEGQGVPAVHIELEGAKKSGC